MKKRIRLTEGQLYRLIENTILNELDVRTKLHAAELADNHYDNAHENSVNSSQRPFSFYYNQAAIDKTYDQRQNFMQGVGDDVRKDIMQKRGYKNYKPELPFNDFRSSCALKNLRDEYQGDKTTGDLPVCGPKKDLNRVFRDYFQRKAYFKNGKWIDSIDDDWNEQEAKEWWAKNGGLPNDPYIGAPNSQDVAEAVIRKLRRL